MDGCYGRPHSLTVNTSISSLEFKYKKSHLVRIRNATTESGQLSLVLVLLLTLNYTLIPLFLGCFAVVLPFAVFQVWCYMVSGCVCMTVCT